MIDQDSIREVPMQALSLRPNALMKCSTFSTLEVCLHHFQEQIPATVLEVSRIPVRSI